MLRGAGFIVHDQYGVIHGYGPTVESAWADAKRTFAMANICILDDGDDSSEQLGSWVRVSDLSERPATQALLILVEQCGGAIDWITVNRVGCTVAEEQAI